MNLEKHDILIIVATTCASIIFMLSMKISDNSTWMTLPVETEELVRMDDNIGSNNSTQQDQLADNKGPMEEKKDLDDVKIHLHSEKIKEDLKIEDIDEVSTNTEIEMHRPTWEEIKKRVEDKGIPEDSNNNMDISVSELDSMIKNLTMKDKIESMSILSKLEAEDIKNILRLYRDGVTYDEEKTVRDILKNTLDIYDYTRLMSIAEKSYVGGKAQQN